MHHTCEWSTLPIDANCSLLAWLKSSYPFPTYLSLPHTFINNPCSFSHHGLRQTRSVCVYSLCSSTDCMLMMPASIEAQQIGRSPMCGNHARGSPRAVDHSTTGVHVTWVLSSLNHHKIWLVGIWSLQIWLGRQSIPLLNFEAWLVHTFL